MNGQVHLNLHFGEDLWWKGVILVGFSEEVVFRGFLLTKLAESSRFWIANLLQGSLFLAIHLPGWWLAGQFAFPGIIRIGGFVFLFGIFLGWVLKRSGSLWACMILHSANNFSSFAIIG